jgi:hypothetical protein
MKGSLAFPLLPLLMESHWVLGSMLKTQDKRTPFLVGGSTLFPQQSREGRYGTVADTPGFISFKNLISSKIEAYPVPIWAHVYNQHPKRSQLFLGATKWTPSAVVFDYEQKQMVAHLKAPGDFTFLGHAAFSLDGQVAYLTAESASQASGMICVYNCQNWKLEQLTYAGRYPHEVLLTQENELCVMSPGSISIFDPASLELKQSIACGDAFHAVALGNGKFLISGGSDLLPAVLQVIDKQTGQILDFKDSPDYPNQPLLGEALSLCVLSDSIVAVTLVLAQTLLIWNIQTNRMSLTRLSEPAGLAFWKNHLFVTSGNGGLLKQFVFGIKPQIDPRLNSDNLQPISYFSNSRHIRLAYISCG